MTTATLFEDEASPGGHWSARPRLILRRAAAAIRDPVVAVLAGMITVWSATFIALGWMRHDHFATLGFDLGIYDQAIWLLSRFKDPFITIRGLEFFGHHVNPALTLFVPFYWLGAGPKFLLVTQVLAQASGAVAIYLLARDRLGERWLAVALAAVLLLNPTYQYLTWEYFHPDALAIAPLLFAYWAARARRWRWFAVAAVLALACKEDVALVMVMMGILIAVRGDRRVGAIVAAGSAIWFAFATRVIIPAANGIGPFYDSFFGDFGKTPTDIVKNALTHPGKTLDVSTQPDRTNYYRMMFAPVAFLPFAALGTLLLAGPMLGINALSTFPYQREIRYHYAAMVLVGIILATVEAIAVVGWKPGIRRFLVGLVAATSLATTVAWGPSPISTKFRSGLWPLGADTRLATKKTAVGLIPSGAATSSMYNFDTHLTHREKIYEFPVPWRSVNWGIHDENLDDPAGVRWIIVDRNGLGDREKALLESLLTGQFETRFDREGILVAKRVRAAQPGEPGKGGQV